ncbi:MAG: UDP-N-acetylmuramoyl-L-alanine--D-glutamate ligase [Deltaproteobacteria bacterium]|nr:UDP-N-acetylmuramoyl-L-alanine--D-glutamate ligase [Deltaproteobacteria bacterium]
MKPRRRTDAAPPGPKLGTPGPGAALERGRQAKPAEQLLGRVGHLEVGAVSQNWPKPKGPARKALVMGLGLSGLAAARLLVRLGFEVIASERRRACELGPEALEMDALGVNLIDEERAFGLIMLGYGGGPDLVVPSPGIPVDHPLLAMAREKRVEVAGEMELASRHVPLPILAVTGSNGKTTVTSLVGHILSRAAVPAFVGGNIGRPLSLLALDHLNDGLGDLRYAVLEVSSFQLETVSRFMARAAAFLNLSPDHLDRHGDMGGYLAAKRRIFNRQGPGETAVLNLDDPLVRDLAPDSRRFCFSRSVRPDFGAYLADGEIRVVEGGATLAARPWSDFRLAGAHNADNVMAAAGLCLAAGVDPALALAAATSFSPSDHRLQEVGTYGGVTFVDDSKGTNVGAVASAIESLGRPVILIMGGRDKGLDFGFLAPLVRRSVKRLIVMGECRDKIHAALSGETETVRAEGLPEAVAAAIVAAAPGDAVLLSPGCASFDQFRDYRHRGEAFASEVRRQAPALEGPGGNGRGPGGGR